MRCGSCGTPMDLEDPPRSGRRPETGPGAGRQGPGGPLPQRLLLLGLGGLLAFAGIRSAGIAAKDRDVERRFQAETERLEELFASEYQARESRHRELVDDPDRWSGKAALRLRQLELDARAAHDPRYADSGSATNLLALARLAKVRGVPDPDALEQITRLAAPKGSRIEVVPEAGGQRVRVAFPMSAVSHAEADVHTRHSNLESLRLEVEERTFDVIRDVLVHARGRGLRRLEVACNHGLHSRFPFPGATPKEMRALSTSLNRCIYRVRVDVAAAPADTDWASIDGRALRAFSVVEDRRIRTIQLVEEELPPIPSGNEAGILEF